MNNKELEAAMQNFKVEELEPRFEMSKWSLSASTSRDWTNGHLSSKVGVTYTF